MPRFWKYGRKEEHQQPKKRPGFVGCRAGSPFFSTPPRLSYAKQGSAASSDSSQTGRCRAFVHDSLILGPRTRRVPKELQLDAHELPAQSLPTPSHPRPAVHAIWGSKGVHRREVAELDAVSSCAKRVKNEPRIQPGPRDGANSSPRGRSFLL